MPHFDYDHYFLREHIIHVDAAVVGVSRARWCHAESGWTNDRAIEFMKESRFDVLPIDDGGTKPVTQYFGTETWNEFSVVRRRAITHCDVMGVDTKIGDMIRHFAFEHDPEGKPRRFFFLTHETRICGLITIASINDRAARAYLYGLFNELETFIGSCIISEVPEDKIRAAEEFTTAIKRYDIDKANCVEADLCTRIDPLRAV
jgi:hypothetical protein